jgi:hypothetical protein
MKQIIVVGIVVMVVLLGCTDAEVTSANLSRAADQFEIFRRVVFYNGITDEYMLVVEGYSSIHVDTTDRQLELTVKVGEGKYVKHFLGLSDNVTYFAEQIDPAAVSEGRYRVIFKPSVIVPRFDIE